MSRTDQPVRALLDMNVLIALLDAGHASHAAAVAWSDALLARHGWASCAITQNGCVRIMASPGYPNARSVVAVAERLAEAMATSLHGYWHYDVFVLYGPRMDLSRVHGARQLTNAYLLALVVAHG